jgi:hypothetical protein
LAYTGTSTQFNNVKFSGSSAISVSSSGFNSSGTVTISGSLSPAAAGPFATLSFDAKGSGVFNADITSLKVNSVSPVFTDPAPLSYTVVVVPLIDTIALSQNSGTSGIFNPYDSFFPSVSIIDQPDHGTATFSAGSFLQPQWTYTPAANFYGADSFTILVRDGINTKEKTIVLNVSPVGTDSNDVFVAGKGVLAINGKSGMDLLIASGAKANYIIAEVVQAGVTRYVVTDKTAADGTNTLTGVERIKFTDTSVALDINGNAGQAYRIYKAALDRAPDLKGLGDWIYALDSGLNSLTQVANGFIGSAEFQGKYGVNTSNTNFTTVTATSAEVSAAVTKMMAGSDGINGSAGVVDTLDYNLTRDGTKYINLGSGQDVINLSATGATEIRLTLTDGGTNVGNDNGTGTANTVKMQAQNSTGVLTGPIGYADDEGTVFVAAANTSFYVRDGLNIDPDTKFQVVILGTSADETHDLHTSKNNYYVSGGQGNDTIVTGSGRGVFCGGAGGRCAAGRCGWRPLCLNHGRCGHERAY